MTIYEIKILPNRRLTILLFCKHALRSNLECEIGTAVEPFHEKDNNVKPACHIIYQGRYYLLIFSFQIFISFAAILSMKIKRLGRDM